MVLGQQCRARSNTRYTRQRMGRLTDTKVRGFMVTETNNDACAQLQPVLPHAACTHASPTSGPERLASSRWAVGPFLSIAIKLNSGMNLRSVSKSTPDPPDACSKERAQTQESAKACTCPATKGCLTAFASQRIRRDFCPFKYRNIFLG